MLNLSLSGRRALVCGASAGIGRSIALTLAEQGAAVTVLARRTQRLRELCAEIEGRGWVADFMTADMDDREALLGLVRHRLDEQGAFHILINNSGGPAAGALLDAEPSHFEKGFARHVLVGQELVQHLLPGMRDSGYGRIINIISTSVREPLPNLGVSNTIRGAMAAWAKTLSRELPPGVTVNNVLPGLTDTERLASLKQAIADQDGQTPDDVERNWLAAVPEGRLAQPGEIAAAVAFLASPAAAYVRGVSLPVDGGRLRSI